MQTTLSSLINGFNYIAEPSPSYWSYQTSEGYEVCIEPLLNNKLYVAFYKDGELLTDKVPFMPVEFGPLFEHINKSKGDAAL